MIDGRSALEFVVEFDYRYPTVFGSPAPSVPRNATPEPASPAPSNAENREVNSPPPIVERKRKLDSGDAEQSTPKKIAKV